MFDRYVSDKKRRRPLLYLAFLVSTILEAGLIIFFIIYSFIHVEEVTPPPLTVQFISSAPPPPPPPPPPKASKPKTPKVIKPVVQPITVPTTITQPKEKEEPEENDSAGSEGGVEGGVPGGVAGSVPTETKPPPPPPKPKNVPAFAIKKDKLGGENPHLPDVIKAQRRGTTVSGSYKICIDTSGHVSSVSPVGSIPGADEPIMSTLRGWTYKPQAVPVCFIENFQFIVE